MRLVGKAVDVYQYLEPLYNDYRKVRLRQRDGSFALSHIDEVSKWAAGWAHLVCFSFNIGCAVTVEKYSSCRT